MAVIFHFIYGMSSFPLTNSIIFQDCDCTTNQDLLPIGSMYAIYGNIYHQYTPNVSIYTSTMDPMGYVEMVPPRFTLASHAIGHHRTMIRMRDSVAQVLSRNVSRMPKRPVAPKVFGVGDHRGFSHWKGMIIHHFWALVNCHITMEHHHFSWKRTSISMGHLYHGYVKSPEGNKPSQLWFSRDDGMIRPHWSMCLILESQFVDAFEKG